MFYVTHKFLLY